METETLETTKIIYENILIPENLIMLFASALIVMVLAAVMTFSSVISEMGDENKK